MPAGGPQRAARSGNWADEITAVRHPGALTRAASKPAGPAAAPTVRRSAARRVPPEMGRLSLATLELTNLYAQVVYWCSASARCPARTPHPHRARPRSRRASKGKRSAGLSHLLPAALAQARLPFLE